MKIRVFGLAFSHHTTKLREREQLALDQEQLRELYDSLATSELNCCELSVLTTCNRVELFVVVDSAETTPSCQLFLLATLAQISGVDVELLEQSATWHHDNAAAEHLCRVASGLESKVFGEPQILGQINKVFDFTTKHRFNGPILKNLFKTAIRCGKRARTETVLSRYAASTGSVAVDLAQQQVGSLNGHQVVLIGTGEIGQLVLQSLHGAGASNVTVLNRTPANALPIAEKYGAQVLGLEALDGMLQSAEIIITATGSQNPILTRKNVNAALAQRTHPLLLIDLSVPRNIAPDVADFSDVTLFDMDLLGDVRAENLAKRKQAIPQIESIIAEEMAAYDEAVKTLAVEPTIGQLHRRADEIRRRELARMLRHLPEDLDPAVREQMQRFSQSLVKKLLHEPTAQLREAAKNDSVETYQSTVRDLFKL